ncbi:MAG: hypothetical protein ACRDTF_06470, partial [Pseudonocardiaceae bacterium]
MHRQVSGGLLAEKQLMAQHAFDSHVDLAAARALTRAALDCLVAGADPAVAVGTAKVEDWDQSAGPGVVARSRGGVIPNALASGGTWRMTRSSVSST